MLVFRMLISILNSTCKRGLEHSKMCCYLDLCPISRHINVITQIDTLVVYFTVRHNLDLPTANPRTNFDRKSDFRESFSSKARSVGHAITSKTTDLCPVNYT